MLVEIKGDLFMSQTSLAHCVSADLKMGAGIAKIFRDKFGGIDELLSQEPQVGKALYLKNENHYIFYLVTKEKYWQKPTYKSLEASLISLNKILESVNIKDISIPLIGCGLDKLKWDKVKVIVAKILENKKVFVYKL